MLRSVLPWLLRSISGYGELLMPAAFKPRQEWICAMAGTYAIDKVNSPKTSDTWLKVSFEMEGKVGDRKN